MPSVTGHLKLPKTVKDRAVGRMSALGNATRLNCVLLLIEAEPTGLLAGEVANQLNVPRNTMSAHFNILKNAGLIVSRSEGRLIHYRVKIESLVDIMKVLFHNYCGGQPEMRNAYLQDFLRIMAGCLDNGEARE